MNPEWIGSIAGMLTTGAYVPQVIKVLRHKHTKSISLGMYIILTCGIAAWVVYGALIGSFSLVASNMIAFVLSLFILLMKLRHG
jgi:MtN3 and saliva related transmembrane protein